MPSEFVNASVRLHTCMCLLFLCIIFLSFISVLLIFFFLFSFSNKTSTCVGIKVHQQLVECTGLVTVMVTVMKVAMEIEKMTGTVMVEIENGAIGMMKNMVEDETCMVRVEIVMIEVQMTTIVNIEKEMMIARKVVAMVTITLHQEIGVLLETNTVLMRMMINVHLGMHLLPTSISFDLQTKRSLTLLVIWDCSA